MENLPRHFLPTASHPGRPLHTLAGHFSRTLSRAVSAESAFSQIRLPPPNKRIFRPSIAQLPSPGYRIHRTSKRECSVLFSPFYFFVNSFPSSARRRLHQNAFWPKMVPRRDFHTHFRPEKRRNSKTKHRAALGKNCKFTIGRDKGNGQVGSPWISSVRHSPFANRRGAPSPHNLYARAA